MFDVVKVILEAGAPMNWSTSSDENGVLHHAVLKKNLKLIALLIKHGADTTQKNKAGQTPIQLAAKLKEKYNINLSELLNVRSFLDHNRIYNRPNIYVCQFQEI